MGKMDKVGATGKSGRPSHSHAADRADIPERNVGGGFVCRVLLPPAARPSLKKSGPAPIFLNKSLEIPRNRVNTHTHTPPYRRASRVNLFVFTEICKVGRSFFMESPAFFILRVLFPTLKLTAS